MTSNNHPGSQKKEPSEKALLAEYQACQHDNSSTSLSYWTLAGIFIGVSSVVLGWLLYALITGAGQIFPFPIVISVVGVAIIVILYLLKRWLKRVTFLADINYKRMREIEIGLGMWKSWRVHGIDHWDELKAKEKRHLTRYKSLDWWRNRGNDSKNYAKYERPTSEGICKRIFNILIGLWGFLITGVWISPLIMDYLNKIS